VSTGRSIHAVPSITPSPREGIEDGPRLRLLEPRANRRVGPKTAATGSAGVMVKNARKDIPVHPPGAPAVLRRWASVQRLGPGRLEARGGPELALGREEPVGARPAEAHDRPRSKAQ
jgi:hypothetical protein